MITTCLVKACTIRFYGSKTGHNDANMLEYMTL
jgi:hypothetical protein